jgi:hypothetical protein
MSTEHKKRMRDNAHATKPHTKKKNATKTIQIKKRLP